MRAIEHATAKVTGNPNAQMPGPQTQSAVSAVKSHLGVGLRASKNSYSFVRPIDDGWAMLEDSEGWWTVFYTGDSGGPHERQERFDDPVKAGAYLIGALVLDQRMNNRPPEEELLDYECPCVPVPQDPPLRAYGNKSVVYLKPGSEIDRYGDLDGNTVYAVNTSLPERSVPPEQAPREYHRFRIESSLRVVFGRALPEWGQPGGGAAYVLPMTLAQAVEDGTLVEIRPNLSKISDLL